AVVGQGTPDGRRLRDDAEGVLSSLPFTLLTGDEAQTEDGYRPVAWLTIRTPYRRTPTATSSCACGRNLTASGTAEVRDLAEAHDYHRTVCHLHNPQERRHAA
ncbi:hypothetical protein ACWF9O_43605, partial [Streptomyces sp. NPDC055085]